MNSSESILFAKRMKALKTVFSRFLLWIRGWEIDYDIKDHGNKFIVIGAPHTSNWDFVYALPALHLMGIKNLRYLIKNSLFFFPLKYLFYWTGGIPVDRSKKNELTAQLQKMIKESDEIYLLFPPEGTRSKVKRWKTGFYYTAIETGLPIILGYMDYKERKLGFGDVFYPTGDFNKDMEVIQAFYSKKNAKHPADFNQSIYEPK